MKDISSDSTIALRVGDPVEDPGELRVLRRLIADLAAAGDDAILYANFITPGRSQRQVDLLIWTPHRVLQVEIKDLDQGFPVIGHLNGDWQQRMPNGELRSLGKNFYRQALNATYGVSDRIAKVTDGGPPAPKPAKSIDTIVCVHPDVPPESELDDFDFVTVMGYQELLARISTPARSQPWTRETWEHLARDLNVYDLTETEDGQADLGELDDYRRRAASSWVADLATLADLGLSIDGQASDAQGLEQRLRAGEGVLLHAPSGFGKTFLARHLAVRLAARGEVVIWLRADEYERGLLHRLLAKATAPFSSARVMDLVRSAVSCGAGIVVVLDGVNECRPADQTELLEQLAAFRLRFRCGVLVTSTSRHSLPDGLAAIVVSLLEPTRDQRIAILHTHGAISAERVSAAFTTPHELELAARCESQLVQGATVTELHDAYIRKLAPSETVRSGLRSVAALLHSEHRSSAPLLDVTARLAGRSGAGLSAELIDDVLASPLFDQSIGRVRFRHDLLRDFLVAEQLVRDAETTGQLADRLREPANHSLVEQALELERDADRVVEVLDILASRDLYATAIAGGFGRSVQTKLDVAAAILLQEAAEATVPGCAHFDAEYPFAGRWIMSRTWARSTTAMLQAVGYVLSDSHLNGIIALLDRTDEFLRTSIDAVDGAPSVSHAVGATYGMQFGESASLPASFVALGIERRLMLRRASGDVSQRVMATPNPGWGRCWVAATTCDGEADGKLLPELVASVLKLGGHHVVLQVLFAVRRVTHALTSDQIAATVEALEQYEPPNWALSNALVEALASLGAITPMNTVDQLRDEISRVLASSDDPAAAADAARIVSNQFEEEEIVGPYCEAIASLDPLDRIRLILLATDHVDPSIHAGWRMRELVGAAPTGDSEVDGRLRVRFAELARAPRVDGVMPQEDVEAFIYAVEGLARMATALPKNHGTLSDDELAWRLVGTILHRLHRGTEAPTATEVWDEMNEVVPGAVPDVLYRLRTSQLWSSLDGEESAHDRLLAAFPTQVRRALHWALDHREQLTSRWRHHVIDEVVAYAVTALGTVGDETSVAVLTPLATNERVGKSAVQSLRAINERCAS